ncbi:ribbon-helix-helix domain-containing protein [Myxococcota bacterium]
MNTPSLSNKISISVTLTPELITQLDSARGRVSRSKIVRLALATWLENHGPAGAGSTDTDSRTAE